MANSKDVVVTGVSTGIGWEQKGLSGAFECRFCTEAADADRCKESSGNGFVPP